MNKPGAENQNERMRKTHTTTNIYMYNITMIVNFEKQPTINVLLRQKCFFVTNERKY